MVVVSKPYCIQSSCWINFRGCAGKTWGPNMAGGQGVEGEILFQLGWFSASIYIFSSLLAWEDTMWHGLSGISKSSEIILDFHRKRSDKKNYLPSFFWVKEAGEAGTVSGRWSRQNFWLFPTTTDGRRPWAHNGRLVDYCVGIIPVSKETTVTLHGSRMSERSATNRIPKQQTLPQDSTCRHPQYPWGFRGEGRDHHPEIWSWDLGIQTNGSWL